MNQVTIKNGSLYLESALYDQYFSGYTAVMLLEDNHGISLLPVQDACGGLMMKIRNSKGDRVIHAREFFEKAGINCNGKHLVDVAWNSGICGLKFDFGIDDTKQESSVR